MFSGRTLEISSLAGRMAREQRLEDGTEALSAPGSADSSPDEFSGLLLPEGRGRASLKFRPGVALAAVGVIATAALLLVGTGPVGGALRHSPMRFQLKAESEGAACCKEYRVECLACLKDETPQEYCKHPDEDVLQQGLCQDVLGQESRDSQEEEREVLLHALSDLMGVDPDRMAKVTVKAKQETAEEIEKEKREKEQEKKRKKEEKKEKRKEAKALAETRREERTQKRLRFKQMTEEKHEKEAQDEGQKMVLAWETERTAIAAGKLPENEMVVSTANNSGPSLYCFSLMMPFGYEPSLLATQRMRGIGIFSCDEATVFSNLTQLVTGEPSPVPIQLVEGSLAVAYGGRWGTALNTGVFNRLWTEVIRQGRYRHHDWVVKVDPDAVFFPERLRQMLALSTPMKRVHTHGKEPDQFKCGVCQAKDKPGTTCFAHVRDLQRQGNTCSKSLEIAARAVAADGCDCTCDDFACDLPDEAMYLNNCKWGLHGPIEVFSRRAVAMYVAGLPKCVELLSNPWGEDKFMDQCMIKLGVKRVDEFHLLSETACGEQPAPCGTSDVAFHPFKSIPSYVACWDYARKYGHGPADPDYNKTLAKEDMDEDNEAGTDHEAAAKVVEEAKVVAEAAKAAEAAEVTKAVEAVAREAEIKLKK